MEETTLSSPESLSQRDKRSLVFHLLYTSEATDYQVPLSIIVAGYQQGFGFSILENSDVMTITNWIIQERDELDEIYKPLLSNWRFDRLGVATKLILRYAVWEMLRTDMQTTVIINEAIELAKCFAEKDAYKFINGILDEVSKKLNRVDALEAKPSDA
jgi:N utilization substance protein B